MSEGVPERDSVIDLDCSFESEFVVDGLSLNEALREIDCSAEPDGVALSENEPETSLDCVALSDIDGLGVGGGVMVSDHDELRVEVSSFVALHFVREVLDDRLRVTEISFELEDDTENV